MDIESLRNLCLSLGPVEESFPFKSSPSTLVFKIDGGKKKKIFAIIDIDKFDKFVNLKLPPKYSDMQKLRYDGVRPGWHMNKKWWCSVFLNHVPTLELEYMVKLSFNTVILTQKIKGVSRVSASKTTTNGIID